MRVLVIDDSDLARMEIERVLKKAGHEVVSKSSPIGATRLIVSEKIDVVVLDVNLPSMRGDKLMQLFRSNPRLRSISVVLTSGMPEEELSRIAEECDADAAVVKRNLDIELDPAIVAARQRRRSIEEAQ